MKNAPDVPSDTGNETGEKPAPGSDASGSSVAPRVADPRSDYFQPLGLRSPQPNAELDSRFAGLLHDTFDYFNEAAHRLSLRTDDSAAQLREKKASGKKLTEAESRCVRAYDKLYGSKDQLEIRVALGYDNYYDTYEPGSTVMDTATRDGLLEFLARPCPADGSVFACGFSYDAATQGLTKTVAGPDGQPRKLHVLVQNSSISVDDDWNRFHATEAQERQTEATRKFFADSLRHADVVIYAGHSRDGGGPSFEPPRLVQDSRKSCSLDPPADHLEACGKHGLDVDYDWYHHHRYGERDMLKALGDADTSERPRWLTLASCFSNNHFADKIEDVAAHTGLLVTRTLLDPQPMNAMILYTIDAVARQTCRRDVLKPLNRPDMIDEDEGHKRSDGNPTIVGFY